MNRLRLASSGLRVHAVSAEGALTHLAHRLDGILSRAVVTPVYQVPPVLQIPAIRQKPLWYQTPSQTIISSNIPLNPTSPSTPYC